MRWEKVAPNIEGTEYSVPVVSVWVLERHHLPCYDNAMGKHRPAKIKNKSDTTRLNISGRLRVKVRHHEKFTAVRFKDKFK